VKHEFLRGTPKNELRSQIFVFSNLIVPLLLVIVGIWWSTQYFAHLCNYDPRLVGRPYFVFKGYPVFYPWLFIGWLLKYWIRPDLGPIFYEAKNPALILSAIALGLFVLIALTRVLFLANQKFFGTARLGTERDLKKKGLLSKEGVVCGQLDNAEVKAYWDNGALVLEESKSSKLICHSGNANTLGLAPSGSGKGVCWITDTSFSYPNSMFILDFKSEIFNLTSGFRSTFSRIFRFAPTERDSLGINFLNEIPSGDSAVRYAEVLADVLTAPKTPKVDEAGEYYITGARGLLMAGILFVKGTNHQDKSLYGVLEMFSNSVQNAEDNSNGSSLMQTWLDAEYCHDVIKDVVTMEARQHLARNDKERGTVMSMIFNALAVFRDPVVRANTSRNDFSISDFIDTKVPISLYFTIPYSDVERLSSLVRVFITFILKRLADGETQYGKVKLKIPLLFMLDEFPVLGKIKTIPEFMGIGRGFNVSFFLIGQSLTQVNDIYGENNPLFEHCRFMITYAPQTLKTAEEISRMIGKQSVNKRSLSTPLGGLFPTGNNGSTSDTETERNLINADELMKLPDNAVMVFCHGMPPYLGLKVPYYDDWRFKFCANEKVYPAPKSRNKLLSYCTPGRYTIHDAWFEVPEGSFLGSREDEERDEALIADWVKEKTGNTGINENPIKVSVSDDLTIGGAL